MNIEHLMYDYETFGMIIFQINYIFNYIPIRCDLGTALAKLESNQ